MTLEMKGIYKSFGANDVLRDVSFTLNGGEICALLGENGAGKSTLMNILGGVHHADQGQILLDGKRVAFQTPADSLKHGIAFIHQELNLVNDLAIYENMFIGHELRKKNRFLDSAAMIAKTNEVFKKMDLDLDPRIMVRDLDASYKQIVEIARALLMEASIIIMDEPTTSLTEPEIRRVFDMMNTLRKSGALCSFLISCARSWRSAHATQCCETAIWFPPALSRRPLSICWRATWSATMCAHSRSAVRKRLVMLF